MGSRSFGPIWLWTFPFPNKHVRKSCEGFFFKNPIFEKKDPNQVYNIFVIMPYPWLTSLWIVENLMECGDVILLAYKYNLQVVIPLLMVTCFETLNSIVEASMFVGCGDELKYEVNMFKVATSF